MMRVGTCEECCHFNKCTFQQTFYIEGKFVEVNTVCRTLTGQTMCYDYETPRPVSPTDWYKWGQLGTKKRDIYGTEPIVCTTPQWLICDDDKTEHEPRIPQQRVEPKEKINPYAGMKKVCMSVKDMEV